MKSVFIAGSRKFYEEIEHLAKRLNENNINAATAGKSSERHKDTPENEQQALINAFKKIDDSDVCYVFSRGGYVGRTVSKEMTYANAKQKEIITSDKIEKSFCRVMVSKTMNEEELIKYCKS